MTAAPPFGAWVKRQRMELGLSQKELAHRAGCAVVTLRKVEAGDLRPSGQMARKLAEALELAPQEQAQFVRLARAEEYWDDRTPAAGERIKPRHNVPAPTSALFGREEELAEVAQLLAEPATRLVTILSPGGMGKTSLAIAAAVQQAEQFADGVCWVPLAPLTEAKDLVLVIAAALGVQLQGERAPQQQIGDFLRMRHLLLVLDNFEHLLEGAPLIGELLATAPQLWILVTSRRRLKLSSETIIFLDGLRAPDELNDDGIDYPAVQMFLLHARRVRPHYEADKQEIKEIAALCRLVHGMPLGILLAAAWTRVISPAQIAEEIERDLGFLQTDMPDVPARQHNLRAVFRHTWSRLSTAECITFMRLSVFRGGVTGEAARHVAGATVEVLAALIDNALLRRLPSGRYEIHELLRQFAQEQLEQDQQAALTVRDAHSSYFSCFLAERETVISSGGQRRAIQEITAELDNIRAAWSWSAERRHSGLLRDAASTLTQYLDWQGRYHEGVMLCEQAIDRLLSMDSGSKQEPALAVLFSAAGWLYIRLGKYGQSHQAFTRSIGIYSDSGAVQPPGFVGEPVLGAALLADVVGNYTVAVELAHQAQAAAVANGDRYNQMLAYYILASTGYAQGEYTAARRRAEQAYSIAAEIDARSMLAYIAIILGNVARACGDDREAQQRYAHSYALQNELGNPEGMAIAQVSLAELVAVQHNYGEAERLFHDSHELYRQINDPGGQVRALIGLGDIAQVRGDRTRAGSYFCTGLELAIAIGSLPLLLLQFTPIGELLASTGEPALAIAAWMLVTQHATGERAMQRRTQADLRRAAAWKTPPLKGQVEGKASADPFAMAALLRDKLAAQKDQMPQSIAAVPPRLPTALPLVEPLSEREVEILRLIANGMTNQQIADRLHVVVGTVKVHNHHIFGKLGVSNRVEALARARELNLLS